MLHALEGCDRIPPLLQVMTALSVAKEALQRKAVSAQPQALAQKAMEQGQAIFTIPEVHSGCLSTPGSTRLCNAIYVVMQPLSS